MGEGQTGRTETYTADGRYIVVDGRKWRATNPAIPENLRQELVDELVSARRAVRSKEPNARYRVGNAKVAHGERGAPWWEELNVEQFEQRAIAIIRSLLSKRAGKSICPSDVARVIAQPDTDWRDLIPAVRALAQVLADAGEVRITQKGKGASATSSKGPIRIYPPLTNE